MNKLLFSFFMSLLMSIATIAQNTDKVNDFAGTVAEVKPYGSGFIYIINDATNDIIEYTANGSDFISADFLDAGTASKLSAWAGDDKAFYYGIHAEHAGMEDLRALNMGSASFRYNPSGHPADQPALTNVIRADFGSDVFYYYVASGEPSENMWVSTNIELYQCEQNDMSQNLNVANNVDELVKLSVQNEGGAFKGVEYDGKFYFVGLKGDGWMASNGLFAIEYNPNPMERPKIEFLAETDAGAGHKQLLVGDDCFYIRNEPGASDDYPDVAIPSRLYYIYKDNLGSVFGIKGFDFHDTDVIESNKKLFGIVSTSGDGIDLSRTLAYVDMSDNSLHQIPVSTLESDEVDNLVLSGNTLYFTAVNNEGVQGIYSIPTNVADPTPSLVQSIGELELTNMSAIPDGIVCSFWNETTLEGAVYAGNAQDVYALNNGNDAWGEVKHMGLIGDDVFVFEEVEGSTSLYKHTLNDVPSNIPDFDLTETTVYPNPTNGLINIQSDNVIVKAQVYNVAGSMLLTQQGNDIQTMELSRLSNGVYILVLTDEAGSVETIKITKN